MRGISYFLLFCQCLATFTGKIDLSNSQVQAEQVSYSFLLNFSKAIPLDGRLVIRFPEEYNSEFSVNCQFQQGFTTTNTEKCSYSSMTRMLTITDAFPTTERQLRFVVIGVTNPNIARTTGSFITASFSAKNEMQETGGQYISVTTTAGELKSCSLSLQNTMVGSESALTISFTNSHLIPSGGMVYLYMPKWNNADPDKNQQTPMISVPSSLSQIQCSFLQNEEQVTTCTFQVNEFTSDILQIQLSSEVEQNTAVQIQVKGVRAPPSQTATAGFQLETANSKTFKIDEAKDQLIFQANFPYKGAGVNGEVYAEPLTVGEKSKVTIIAQNTMPLEADTTVIIVVPPSFNMDKGKIDVSVSGAQLNKNADIYVSSNSRTITITQFNLNYLQALSQSYFYISGMGNPESTERTSSFEIQFLDQNNKAVEIIDEGMTVQCKVGTFTSVALSINKQEINARRVYYTFSLKLQDSFNSNAIIQVKFPEEFWVEDDCLYIPESNNMVQGMFAQLYYNRLVIISGAMPAGYRGGDEIKFTITSVVNPIDTRRTPGISVKIYYQEFTAEIAQYLGNELSVKAEPSQQLTLAINLSSQLTGQVPDNFTVELETPPQMQVARSSYLTLFIPGDYKLQNPLRIASSCTKLLGFSDEITCTWLKTTEKMGSTLLIKNGFASQNFAGGKFSFQLSEIMNPFTEEVTDTFGASIYDFEGNLLYELVQQNEPRVVIKASPFSFAFIKSQSGVNGESSIYDFSVTLSVDTLVGSKLAILLPSQILFDNSKPFFCNATMNLASQFKCNKRNEKSIWIDLIPPDTLVWYIQNGTSIGFQIGHLFNPPTLKPSESFHLMTFQITQTTFTTVFSYINVEKYRLQVKNTERGEIIYSNIEQIGSKELGEETQLLISISTANLIPEASILTLILPSNLHQQANTKIRVDGWPIDNSIISYSPETHKLSFPVYQANKQNFIIFLEKGFTNPVEGPYSYTNFNFEFDTSDGWGIDQGISTDQQKITTNCATGCVECEGSLNHCVSCGTDTNTNIAYYLLDKKCYQTCPDGFYGSPDQTCEPCELPCLTCSFGKDLCTSCDPNSNTPFSNLETLSCGSECPAQTYPSPDQKQCLECKSPCYTCLSENECLSCDTSEGAEIYFFQNQCLRKCPSISVQSPSKLCVECEYPCKECEGMPDLCTSCVNGLYLWRGLCIEKCPWKTYRDNTNMVCQSVASIDIPMPFTIMIACFSVGVFISSRMKYSTEYGSTAFLTTMLPVTDMTLKLNWFILAILTLSHSYIITFYGCLFLLVIGVFINVVLWRRFFKFKYNMDDNDRAFSTYCNNYPKTSQFIIFLSYSISFQAIRLTYCHLLGKKTFMASFTRQKKYYRFISQLSLIQIFFQYLPALFIFAYCFAVQLELKPGKQLFYLAIDSVILVFFAIVLITLTLLYREKVMQPRELFQWAELFQCQVDTDDEKMYEEESDDKKLPGSRVRNKIAVSLMKRVEQVQTEIANTESNLLCTEVPAFSQREKVQLTFRQKNKVMDDSNINQNCYKEQVLDYWKENKALSDEDKLEIRFRNEYQSRPLSAKNYRDFIRSFKHLYRAEKRDKSVPIRKTVVLHNIEQIYAIKEKINRIKLKSDLFENRRDNDYMRMQKLSKELTHEKNNKKSLNQYVKSLQTTLEDLREEIDNQLLKSQKTSPKLNSTPQLPVSRKTEQKVFQDESKIDSQRDSDKTMTLTQLFHHDNKSPNFSSILQQQEQDLSEILNEQFQPSSSRNQAKPTMFQKYSGIFTLAREKEIEKQSSLLQSQEVSIGPNSIGNLFVQGQQSQLSSLQASIHLKSVQSNSQLCQHCSAQLKPTENEACSNCLKNLYHLQEYSMDKESEDSGHQETNPPLDTKYSFGGPPSHSRYI